MATKRLLLAIAAFATFAANVSAQVTSNVLYRVFLIKNHSEIGSAFTIDVDGRQYLITAKHVLKGMKEAVDDTIQIRKNDSWSDLTVKVFRCNDPVDIAVLIPPSQLSVDFPLEPTLAGVLMGGEAFFVGFPYAMTTGSSLEGGYPMPLTKKATVSGLIPLVSDKGVVLVLDGYNNPGFSGSPVVFHDNSKGVGMFNVGGVVVSFLPEAGPVLKTEEVTQAQITDEDRRESRILQYEGKLYRITRETTDFVRLNTGIAFAHDVKFAVDLIHQHPIGPKVADDFRPK
jgi:hypothetical protein